MTDTRLQNIQEVLVCVQFVTPASGAISHIIVSSAVYGQVV